MTTRKMVWTVRLINYRRPGNADRPATMSERDELPGLWVEQLRYMGCLRELATYADRSVIEFYPPKGVDSGGWANMNAERMRSFGLNAVAAPAWNGIAEDLELNFLRRKL